ncbi:MAG: hypothetical protein C5B51_04355 [Terriglobia bacterium]|nr:MAG: hypothetical protein C5B51_04355 [Terriglobia bacterium]
MRKTAVALFFSFAALALAQDDAIKAKRVASVTWDLQNHKLIWTVENGLAKNGEFVPSSKESYEISPKDGAMTFGGEQRGFTAQEAVWLQRLLNVLTIYCAESVVWWDAGEGLPLNEDGTPAAVPQDQNPEAHPAESPDNGRRKVAEPEPQKTPGAIRLVAQNRIR